MQRVGAVQAVRTETAEPPEHVQQVGTVRVGLGNGAQVALAETGISLPTGLPGVVLGVVLDLDGYVSGEVVGEAGEKFAVLLAASVTWANIQPCSSRIFMAVFIDSSGTEPL